MMGGNGNGGWESPTPPPVRFTTAIHVVCEWPQSGYAVYDVTLPATDPSEPGRFVMGFGDLGAAVDWVVTTEGTLCQWFALCTNPATTTRNHPIIGAVPICERCNAKVDRIGGGQ